MKRRSGIGLTALASGLALTLAACGGGGAGEGEKEGDQGAKALSGQTIEVIAKWSGSEQENFEQVLKAFEDSTGADVQYTSGGEQIKEKVGSKIEGGSPPGVVIVPQPALVGEYQKDGVLKELPDDVVSEIDANFAPYWKDLASVDGKVYGVMTKGAHKSTVWYSQSQFDDAGVEAPPETWDDLTGPVAQQLSDAGSSPFSMCGASGWTLTDLFENLYLSIAGGEKYDQLTDHKIPWTDQSVADALEAMKKIKPDFMEGGTKGALATEFPACATKVFAENKGAMVIEADFVADAVGDTDATIGEEAKIFPFPKAGETQPVVFGGDIAVAMKDDEATMELMKYLASADAGTTWAGLGGYMSPNKNVKPEAYKDPVAKELAATIPEAGDDIRYDMSDLVPTEFGGDQSPMWKQLQAFLSNGDVKGTQEKLEAAAKKAYK